jgi:hypothetical protein
MRQLTNEETKRLSKADSNPGNGGEEENTANGSNEGG